MSQTATRTETADLQAFLREQYRQWGNRPFDVFKRSTERGRHEFIAVPAAQIPEKGWLSVGRFRRDNAGGEHWTEINRGTPMGSNVGRPKQ